MTFAFHAVAFNTALNNNIATLVNVCPSGQDDNKPVIIYDLDGTIANDDHRKHHVTGEVKDFATYFSLIHKDEPNWPVIEQLVADSKGGADIVILTGREDDHVMATLRQLHKFQIAQYVSSMFMRPHGYYVPAAQFKEEAIGLMVQEGFAITAIVDDDPTIRTMAEELKLVSFDPAKIIEDSLTPKLVMPGDKDYREVLGKMVK